MHAARGVAALLAPVVFTLAGCTAMLEVERPQCSDKEDCITLFGAGEPFECVRQLCERPSCNVDDDCRKLDPRLANSICDLKRHECLAAECTSETDCGNGRACDVATNRCVERQCTIKQDCIQPDTESPTIDCVSGLCVDEAWGCVGQPDNRPFSPGDKATLRVPLYDPLKNGPLEGSDWKALVCRPADEDPDCRSPLDVPTSYDPETGILTVEQLDPTLPVRLWLDEVALPPDMTRLNFKQTVDMEFITQKPPVGVMTTKPLRVVTWSWIASLIKSYQAGAAITGDTTALTSVFIYGKQTIFGDAFDCQDRPAAGINVKVKDAAGVDVTGYTPYFWDEQNIAFTRPSHFQTFGTGVWSTANLPINETLLLRSNLVLDPRDERSRLIRDDIPVYLNLSRMMTIHLYPRNYGVRRAQ